ncbi:hypothetical protein J1N35_036777 [Gossypium stocksii]|uniref:Uncharacterized protein n=1 Tax=Gossypium stocksii TaxID=47602 RepID=A0A9D3ZKZ9_9ROSI|nr:hypothetical protein J1N35_036777 [Gossypium stocksii]
MTRVPYYRSSNIKGLNVGNWRTGVEFLGRAGLSSNINITEEGKNEEGDTVTQRGKGKRRMSEEILDSGSLTEKRSRMNAKEGRNKMRIKRKKGKGCGAEGDEESPVRLVKRKLLNAVSPSKAAVGEQLRQEP